MLKRISATIQRWNAGQLAVFWLAAAYSEIVVLRLGRVGIPGWGWGSDPTLHRSDPFGYHLFWQFDHLFYIVGTVGTYLIPPLVLAVTWIWFARSR